MFSFVFLVSAILPMTFWSIIIYGEVIKVREQLQLLNSITHLNTITPVQSAQLLDQIAAVNSNINNNVLTYLTLGVSSITLGFLFYNIYYVSPDITYSLLYNSTNASVANIQSSMTLRTLESKLSVIDAKLSHLIAQTNGAAINLANNPEFITAVNNIPVQ